MLIVTLIMYVCVKSYFTNVHRFPFCKYILPGYVFVVANLGLQPGAKPPPLTTMMNPTASKLSRNTATVPPLNQVSPSNGVTSVSTSASMNATRTASFAAALRKLAHQAKDPGNEVSNVDAGLNRKHRTSQVIYRPL